MQILLNDKERFQEAVKTASMRTGTGLHGSVGTQNEKLIHSALKNFFVPFSDEQEIKIGNFFADAVSEDGIFEIQTKDLYRLCEKLKVFLEYSEVTVVHPVIRRYRTVYINSESGEIVYASAFRNLKSNLSVFDELYSLRRFLNDENLRIVLAEIAAEKRVYFHGNEIPDITNKTQRRKCVIEKAPLELLGGIVLERQNDYLCFLPENLPQQFTKKELCKAASESRSSLRTEILRTVGIIEKVSKKGREYIYRITEKIINEGDNSDG